jgi:hypothetical protein
MGPPSGVFIPISYMGTGKVSLSFSPPSFIFTLLCYTKINPCYFYLVRLLVVRHLEMLFMFVDLKELWFLHGN